MTTNTQRLFFLITTCSLLGLGVGAVTNRIEAQECLTGGKPSDRCLTQNPGLDLLAGMGQGMLIGGFAALGASWNVLKED